MITSVADEGIKDVRVTNHELVVALVDGRTLSVPLVWYPRLLNATAEQRNDWQLIGDGEGVHWPQIDEDLSGAGLLRGVPAPADRPHHPPAKESGAQAGNMAKDVYSDSIGEAKSKLQHDRSQLESLAEQLPREETKQRIRKMVDAYSGIEQALDQAAQALGVEERLIQTLQQGQEAGGQVASQVAEGIHDEPDATETARQRAEELRVDLSQIEGSGAKGRITVKDVTRAAHQ